MKNWVWDAVGSAFALLRGNSDGSAHADLRKVGGTAVAAGAAVKAASIPVNIASDQLGAAAKAASLPVNIASDQLGAAAKAASLPVNIASDQLGAQAKAASLSVTLATDLVGPAAKAAALAVTMATDQPAIIVRPAGDYETVAASQIDQVMGATGAIGDYLEQLLISPDTTSPGAVSIKDGAGSSIPIFAGGASSVATLDTIWVPIRAAATGAGWKVTTGANVTAIATGKFT